MITCHMDILKYGKFCTCIEYVFGITVCTNLVFILSTKLEFQYPFVNFTQILSNY